MEQPFASPAPLPPDSPVPRAKVSMLAWWGVISVAALIAIEVVYGWPQAKAKATVPEAAISYLMGHILGALLVALVVAWVAFRIGKRSQLSATIVFSVVVGISCLSVLAASRRGQPPAPLTGPASFGAFQFEVPAGWKSVPPDRAKTMAILLLNGTARNEPDGMLKVDVAKPAFPTAREVADVLAGNDGRVSQDPVSLDGIEGVRVDTSSTDMSRPRFAVVVFRDEMAYLIMAAGANGADVSKAFDQVLKTWRWTETRKDVSK